MQTLRGAWILCIIHSQKVWNFDLLTLLTTLIGRFLNHYGTGNLVNKELEKLNTLRGTHEKICVDNGPEFICNALNKWAKERNIEIKFIEPWKPHQNGYIERFNRSFSEEVLDAYFFDRLQVAQTMAYAWLWIYNNVQPHSSLGYKPPVAFLDEIGKGLNETFPSFVQYVE